MIVVARCHALSGAPRPARGATICRRPSHPSSAARARPRNRLRPPDATGIATIDAVENDERKAYGTRTCRGCEGAGLHACSATAGSTVSLNGFQGPQPRPLFLSQGRHPGLHQGSHRIFDACARPSPKPAPIFSASRPIRLRRRTNSNPSTSSQSRSPPTKPKRCWKLMALGVRNRCTGANSWASSARLS